MALTPIVTNGTETGLTAANKINASFLVADAAETKLATIAEGSEVNTIESIATGISGASVVTNVVSISQANYDLITPDASTLYIVVA